MSLNPEKAWAYHIETNVTSPASLVTMFITILSVVSLISFYFIGTKFRGLTTMDMFVDTWIRGFQITGIRNITKVNNFFIRILNSWIPQPTKTTKLNVQRIKMILHYIDTNYIVRLHSRGRPGGHHSKTKVTSTARQCLQYWFIITTLCYFSSTYTIINITKVFILFV